MIIDGLPDKPCKALQNKTPLEIAFTPNLDWLAQNGLLMQVNVLGKKIAPESDTAVMALLGYNPFKYYTGRGALEAIGANIKWKKGIAFRTNFATIKENKIIDRRVGRSLTTKEAKELEKEINSKAKLPAKFKFTATIEHRGVLFIQGNFSDKISNTDPAYEKHGSISEAVGAINDIQKCRPLEKTKKAIQTASIINEFAKSSAVILSKSKVNAIRKQKRLLEANYLLLRGPSIKPPTLPSIQKKTKKNWLAVCGMPLEKGIAKLCGMKVNSFNYPEIKTLNYKKEIENKLKTSIKAALTALKKEKKTNAYYIHFKETDVFGHDGNPFAKKKMIEIIDKEFFSKLIEKKIIDLNKDKLIITADHSTPSELKRHSSDYVPLLVCGKGIKKSNAKKFSEKEAKKTGKTIKGTKAMEFAK